MPATDPHHDILDAIAAGLIVLDARGTIVFWNTWMANASGVPRSGAIGRKIAQVFPNAPLVLLDRAVGIAIETGASTLLTNALHPALLPLRTRAGRELLHDITIARAGDAGRPSCIVQISDVTDATRREQFLRARQNARYDALVQGAPDVILNIDGGGTIRLANPAAAQQFGHAVEQLVGMPVASLFENEADWRAIAERLMASDAPVGPVEVALRRKDGTLRYFGASASRWQDGTRTFFSAIFRDVNDRRIAEQRLRESERRSREDARTLEQLNRVLEESSKALNAMDRRKDEFLATLAHELRNPLAPLRNGLQLLKLAKEDFALIERTRHMMEMQVNQLVRLIDDLLDVSRITSDRLTLATESTSLDRVIRQAVETSSPSIDLQQHTLTIDIPDHDICVDADVVRLTQVFANLLNNAAKYTPRGGQITIRVEQHGNWVNVHVIDNGIGISRDMLSKVFDMFTQVDNSLERAQGGLGIGLSLVKRLVEMHSGTVEAFSRGPGSGSEFVVRLPVASADCADSPDSEGGAAAERHGRRVLVVDDNQDSATSLALLLEMMGHETRTAFDGLEALQVAQVFQPDIALLDIGMPKLNGYETARQIREQSWGRDMVLIALTGWGQDSDRERSKEAGFDTHLVKPVEAAEIQRLIARLECSPASLES